MLHTVGRDISVGIATGYGMDGPGVESRCGGEIFRARPERPWFPTSILYSEYWVSFPEVKQSKRGADHSPHLAPWLKKEYSYTSTSPLGLRGLF